MRASLLKKIKKDLEARRKDVLNGAGEAMNNDLNKQSGNLPDPTDLASTESDQSFSIRLRERETKLLGKINEALDRIEDGTYGICEICEGKIKEKRIEARPVTTMCIKCKTEQEEKESRLTP
jgi:DnaK suppressor protein